MVTVGRSSRASAVTWSVTTTGPVLMEGMVVYDNCWYCDGTADVVRGVSVRSDECTSSHRHGGWGKGWCSGCTGSRSGGRSRRSSSRRGYSERGTVLRQS